MKSMFAAVAALGFIASPALAQDAQPTDNAMAAAPAKSTAHHATHHAAKQHASHCSCASHHKATTLHHTAKATSTTKSTTGK